MQTPPFGKPFLTLFIALCLLPGCITVPDSGKVFESTGSEQMETFLSEKRVPNKKELETSIARDLESMDPEKASPDAIASISNRLILLATAYTHQKSEKRRLFLQAMAVCERAMMKNPEFRKRIEAGESVWDACVALDEASMEPMFNWATAVLYLFKEGFTFPTQLFHAKWLKRASAILDHMESIDPYWHGGAILFSKAIVKFAVPKAIGGDKPLAWELIGKAVEVEGNWMLSRWGRAVYFHTTEGNRDAYVADLEKVLTMDPDADGEHVYWRYYFYEDAQKRLESVDDEF
jgi:hypothetical protein